MQESTVKRYEQVQANLRKGMQVFEACKKAGISQGHFYAVRKKLDKGKPGRSTKPRFKRTEDYLKKEVEMLRKQLKKAQDLNALLTRGIGILSMED